MTPIASPRAIPSITDVIASLSSAPSPELIACLYGLRSESVGLDDGRLSERERLVSIVEEAPLPGTMLNELKRRIDTYCYGS